MIPTLNEEAAIAPTIREIREVVPDCEIVVIDGCSSDKTVEMAERNGAMIILVPERGKGNAIRKAIPLLGETDIVVMMDGDFTYPAQHIPAMVRYIESGDDVVVGYRAFVAPGAMPVLNTLGNIWLSMLASCLYVYPMRDVCTGMWAFRMDVLEKMELHSPRFTLEAELFGEVRRGCWRDGWKFRQVPIGYRKRLDGSRPKLRVSDGFEIAMFLIEDRFRNRKR
jgi:dolichol-phosphate mannosyltransferase